MRNKPLELTLYAAGAGAFGVFLRWLEDQLAFNEEGLADPSAFHYLVPLFLVASAISTSSSGCSDSAFSANFAASSDQEIS